jgi:hypothetical protein
MIRVSLTLCYQALFFRPPSFSGFPSRQLCGNRAALLKLVEHTGNMGDFNLVFPSATPLAICFFLSLIMLALLHLAAAHINRLLIISDEKEGQRGGEQGVSARSFLALVSLTKWLSLDWSSHIKWDGLPQLSLPVSFSVADNEMVGAPVGKGMGVGMELVKFDWKMRRLKPGFDTPRKYAPSAISFRIA